MILINEIISEINLVLEPEIKTKNEGLNLRIAVFQGCLH